MFWACWLDYSTHTLGYSTSISKSLSFYPTPPHTHTHSYSHTLTHPYSHIHTHTHTHTHTHILYTLGWSRVISLYYKVLLQRSSWCPASLWHHKVRSTVCSIHIVPSIVYQSTHVTELHCHKKCRLCKWHWSPALSSVLGVGNEYWNYMEPLWIVLCWFMGYGSLGKKSTFFLDAFRTFSVVSLSSSLGEKKQT